MIRLHEIFGSERLSYKAPAIRARSVGPYAVLNKKEASELDLKQGQSIKVSKDKWSIEVPLQTHPEWPENTIGIAYGFPETGKNIPEQVEIKKK